jgi:hypothetical protein
VQVPAHRVPEAVEEPTNPAQPFGGRKRLLSRVVHTKRNPRSRLAKVLNSDYAAYCIRSRSNGFGGTVQPCEQGREHLLRVGVDSSVGASSNFVYFSFFGAHIRKCYILNVTL